MRRKESYNFLKMLNHCFNVNLEASPQFLWSCCSFASKPRASWNGDGLCAKHWLGKQSVALLLLVLLLTSLWDLGQPHGQTSLGWSLLQCLAWLPSLPSVCVRPAVPTPTPSYQGSECTKGVATQVIVLRMCVRERTRETLLVRGRCGRQNLQSKEHHCLFTSAVPHSTSFASLKVQKYLQGLYFSVILHHFQGLSVFIYKVASESASPQFYMKYIFIACLLHLNLCTSIIWGNFKLPSQSPAKVCQVNALFLAGISETSHMAWHFSTHKII